MSFNLSYNPICRDCCNMDKISHVIQVTNVDEKKYMEYLNMTEYEANKIVEGWLKDFGPCRNCGSYMIFPTNIEIGNKKLYDFNKLVEDLKSYGIFGNLLILDLQNNYGEIELKIAGKQHNDRDFLEECSYEFFKVIDDIPNSKFVSKKTNGNFQLVISGKYENERHNLKVERLINYGFSLEDIKQHILKYFFSVL